MANDELTVDSASRTLADTSASHQLSTIPEPLPGYKRTTAVVIPEDWETTTLSVVSESIQNGVFFKPSLKGVGVKLINVGDLYARSPIDSETLELFDATEEECDRFKVENGDLFFTRSSVVPSGIAQCNIYLATSKESVVFDSHVIRLRPAERKVDSSYLFRFCQASIARNYLVSHAKTGTMTTIDQGVLGKCPVFLPPLPEQRAIAAALADVDALLAKLDQRIAKQRDLKQAAMQELLTGRTRLPGFAGEWEVKRMSDIFSITTGSAKSAFVTAEGNYWVVDMGSVSVDGRLFVSKATNYFGDFLSSGDLVMPKDDIGGGNIIGKVGYIDADDSYVLGDHVYRLVTREGDSLFLSYVINSYRTNIELRKKVIGSAQLGLGRKSVDDQEISFPTYNEQTAIAAVLSDMDAELAALEARRDKTHDLKQGMMQELLTGRVRLT